MVAGDHDRMTKDDADARASLVLKIVLLVSAVLVGWIVGGWLR